MWLIRSLEERVQSCYWQLIHFCIPAGDESPVIITNLVSWRVRQYETFGHFRLMLAWDYRMRDELFSFLFLSLLSSRALSVYHWEQQLFMSCVSMDTIIDSSNEFDTCVVCMCVFAHLLHLSHTLYPFPTRSLFTATSSTRLEDLSYLDHQRAPGHRGSVRKHNTAGRTNDDSKGILWLNLRVKSVCKYSLVQKHLQTCTCMNFPNATAQITCSYPFLRIFNSFQGDWCHSNKLTSC